MRLISNFFPRPYPLGWRADVADDRLAALGAVDMLNRHLRPRQSYWTFRYTV
jgi:hypothetical protein